MALSRQPSVILAPYYLSKLPNQPARRRKLQELWDTGAETIVSRSEAVPFITRAQGIITNKQILIDEGSTEGFRMIADARQYLLDLGRQTPVGAEGLDREDIDRILLRERRRAKKARQKSRAFEGVGGVIEYVDGQEVLRIGDQLYYPEVVNSTTSEGGAEAFEPIEDKEDLDEEETVSTQRPMISDRFVGSHVLAPVRIVLRARSIRHTLTMFSRLKVSARWCLSVIVNKGLVSLFSASANASIRSEDQAQKRR
jgi:hypothetical protein